MNGENLKSALEKKGITQRELADILGCSVNTVWRWCNNKQEVSDKIKKRLSEILDVSISYLMGESGDFFLKLYDSKNLPKELASYFGVAEPEPGTDFPGEQDNTCRDGVLPPVQSELPYFNRNEARSVAKEYPKDGGLPDNRIIIETGSGKDVKRYILPATPESYDFLKRLNETEREMSPEKSTVLKMMESMTQEEIRAILGYISAKKI